ncbi:tetratricopeptide repeat (TPR)-like superfamily protein [Tasmannia lanceolata]|uniref:tetratricopeptide repeat (TPR)-like superfamily protein n=1 Tax=Tasmannia lanceolata TaxID=3420 RepID=UPI0040646474
MIYQRKWFRSFSSLQSSSMRNSLQKALNLNTQSNPSLIKAYCEKGLLKEARQLFDEIPQRDVVTWTAMISGYTSCGNVDHAWMVFRDMQREGMDPNAFTISNVVKACKGMESCFCGATVHGLAIKHGLDGCMYVENSLVDMYATCSGDMGDACMVFEGIQMKTGVSWTTMIAGYTRRAEGYAGIRVFRRMLQDGVELNPFSCSIVIRACASVGSLIFGKQIHSAAVKSGLESNLPVGNSLVDMYCRCICLAEAKQYFNDMLWRDLITLNTLIAGFERVGSHESLRLFSQMSLYDLKPNCFTFTSIAAASANLAVLSCGQQVHGGIIRRGYGGSVALANALIDMYAKCGCIADSRRFFDEMPRRDLVSWTSMMIGYGYHGYGREAIKLFNEMVGLGFQPDHVVFMGVLSACSHAGLVDEGLKFFESMCSEYCVHPDQEIYGCAVDLLGRAGRVTEAYKLLETMPFEADESVWGALLGACKVHRNSDLGRLAAQKILQLRPKGAETYVILSNIYASDGKWSEFAKTRKIMKEIGSKKETGRSWIELRDQVHSFAVGERFSPNLELVYKELQMLVQHMKDAGYVPDSDCLLHYLEDET